MEGYHPGSIKDVFLKTAENFTGHGISNLFAAKTKLARFAWLIVILGFAAFCNFYIVNSFTDFFSYEVLSSIRIISEKEMIYPAVVICGWYSEYPIDQGIIYYTFNSQDCQITGDGFEKVEVLGYGKTKAHFCIRFNGRNKLEESKNEHLSVQSAGFYGPGLYVSFLVPDEVI